MEYSFKSEDRHFPGNLRNSVLGGFASALLLIACAAFLATPAQAGPVLYVTLPYQGTVSEYDATTGAVINANFITGLNRPDQLLVYGDTLFVADEGGEFLGYFRGSVGTYNVTTGAAINPSFIEAEPGGAFSGMAVWGDYLYVVDGVAGTVGKYYLKTGYPINYDFVIGAGAFRQASSLGVLGDKLYVEATASSQLGEVSVKTGNFSSVVATQIPSGIAFYGDKVLASSMTYGTISEFDAKTLQPINPNFITGASYPEQIAILGDKLYVASFLGSVAVYDAKTGAVINAALISGLANPTGLAIKP
jgi:hypothetical protein